MLLALFSSCLTNCATTPDELICTEINTSRGWCTRMISDEEFFIDDEHPYSFNKDGSDPKTWWDLRPFFVLLPRESWEKIKIYIIQQCKKNGGCNANVGTWERKIINLDDKIKNN